MNGERARGPQRCILSVKKKCASSGVQEVDYANKALPTISENGAGHAYRLGVGVAHSAQLFVCV